VLRRFKVVFDYSRKHVILERTSAGDEPFDADMSGGSLVATGPDLNVFTVEHPGEFADTCHNRHSVSWVTNSSFDRKTGSHPQKQNHRP
jgi:hypothetical protein